MTGYVRQDTSNNISNGSIINADDLDGEFNAIETAFNAVNGHTHDGTSESGAPITTVGPTQDVTVSGTQVLPKTDNTVDLGSGTYQFKDAYLSGTVTTDTLQVDTDATVSGNLDVTGNISAANILDEDDMASDSATSIPTQQSVKAYVDATIASEAVVEIVASGSVSAVASLDITGLDTSAYNYELVISNFIPVTDNVNCNLRLSDSALSNFELCWFSSLSHKTDGVERSIESVSDTGIQLNCEDQVGSAAGEYGITCTLSLSQASSAPMQVTGNFAYEDNVGVYNAGFVGGGQLTTTAINAIRIAFSSGNIESGEYTLYRKAKS